MAEFDEVNVQLKFRVATERGEFQDAIYMKKSEYEAKTGAEIEALKQARVDNWISSVTTVPVELTKEEEALNVQNEIDSLTERITELKGVKAELIKG